MSRNNYKISIKYGRLPRKKKKQIKNVLDEFANDCKIAGIQNPLDFICFCYGSVWVDVKF